MDDDGVGFNLRVQLEVRTNPAVCEIMHSPQRRQGALSLPEKTWALQCTLTQLRLLRRTSAAGPALSSYFNTSQSLVFRAPPTLKKTAPPVLRSGDFWNEIDYVKGLVTGLLRMI